MSAATLPGLASWAVLSDDGVYRYELGRRWADGPCDLWIMLNPSTADATLDDPTIRRCIGFSKGWGAGSLIVVNLFALRATDPAALLRHPDPVGPDNDERIADLAASAERVVAAWGAHKLAAPRARELARGIADGDWTTLSVKALGTTKAGAPRHPLYVRGDTELVPL